MARTVNAHLLRDEIARVEAGATNPSRTTVTILSDSNRHTNGGLQQGVAMAMRNYAPIVGYQGSTESQQWTQGNRPSSRAQDDIPQVATDRFTASFSEATSIGSGSGASAMHTAAYEDPYRFVAAGQSSGASNISSSTGGYGLNNKIPVRFGFHGLSFQSGSGSESGQPIFSWRANNTYPFGFRGFTTTPPRNPSSVTGLDAEDWSCFETVDLTGFTQPQLGLEVGFGQSNGPFFLTGGSIDNPTAPRGWVLDAGLMGLGGLSSRVNFLDYLSKRNARRHKLRRAKALGSDRAIALICFGFNDRNDNGFAVDRFWRASAVAGASVTLDGSDALPAAGDVLRWRVGVNDFGQSVASVSGNVVTLSAAPSSPPVVGSGVYTGSDVSATGDGWYANHAAIVRALREDATDAGMTLLPWLAPPWLANETDAQLASYDLAAQQLAADEGCTFTSFFQLRPFSEAFQSHAVGPTNDTIHPGGYAIADLISRGLYAGTSDTPASVTTFDAFGNPIQTFGAFG